MLSGTNGLIGERKADADCDAGALCQGMTFDEYVAYVGSPREPGAGARMLGLGWTTAAFLREAFEKRRLTEDQEAALRWLVAQPKGPAKMLVLSEEWSSDCRRDVPTFARMAVVTGMELRIFPRDGQSVLRRQRGHRPDGNWDLMAQFLNHKNGRDWPSIPMCAVLHDATSSTCTTTRSTRRFTTRIAWRRTMTRRSRMTAGGSCWSRRSYRIWTSAAVDEIVSALHRKAVLGGCEGRSRGGMPTGDRKGRQRSSGLSECPMRSTEDLNISRECHSGAYRTARLWSQSCNVRLFDGADGSPNLELGRAGTYEGAIDAAETNLGYSCALPPQLSGAGRGPASSAWSIWRRD